MRRRRTVEDWMKAVFGSKAINDATRVLLLYLGGKARMDRNSGLVVSVPRTVIAKDLGRSERRIDERFRWARDAGFLSSIARGFEGQTAEYGLTFPDAESLRNPAPSQGAESASSTSRLSTAESRTLSRRESATPGGRAIDNYDASLTPCESCGGNGCALCCGPEPHQYLKGSNEQRSAS